MQSFGTLPEIVAYLSCSAGHTHFAQTNYSRINSNKSQDQFTCDDAGCIDLVKRCNLVPDCVDKSDESHCVTLSTNKFNFNFYDKTFPPFDHSETSLDLNVSISIEEVVQIGIK